MGARGLVRELSVVSDAMACALSIAQGRFGTFLHTTPKGSSGDIVTDVDLLCEEKVTEIIRTEFPEHSVIVEESRGFHAAGPWSWIVDPLDGTNNYAYGLPLWGISITLCYQGRPVIACIAEGFSGSIIKAVANDGVWVNEKPWAPNLDIAKHRTAALWIGYDTNRQAADFQDLVAVLSKSTRRVFENWAPTVDVGLFLRRGIDIIVGKGCSGTELPAALLVLREAGACILDIHGAEVSLDNIPNLFIAGRPGVAHPVLRDLQAAVKGT
jgi:myo-inositol-1(or 4)-monophosphatase